MYLFKAVLNCFAVQTFFFCVFIKNVICLRVKQVKDNVISESSSVGRANPWEKYMTRFNITKNHKSGVYQDLGGNVEILTGEGSPKKRVFYRFPTGACPVFGKYVTLLSEGELHKGVFNPFKDISLHELNNENVILDYLMKGTLPRENANTKIPGLNFNAARLGNSLSNYKELISPIKKDSIYECAQYASRFNHTITNAENVAEHIYHPFVYDLNTTNCYILFPLQQTIYKASDSSRIGTSLKNIKTSAFVFGTWNIQSDWANHCPIKTIKGARFGYWNGTHCDELDDDDETNVEAAKDVSECAETLFYNSPDDVLLDSHSSNVYEKDEKSDGKGLNWANFLKNCVTMFVAPNCLIHDNDAYAITATAILHPDVYDLPPCFEETFGWKITATCGNIHEKQFTCNEKKMWVTDNGDEITNCDTTVSWLTFDNKNKNKNRHGSDLNPTPRSTSNKNNSAAKSWTGESFIAGITFLIINVFFF